MIKNCTNCKYCQWEHPFGDEEEELVVWCIREGFNDEYKGYPVQQPTMLKYRGL